MTSTAPSSKLLLVADPRAGTTDRSTAVRRFRLARLRLQGRPAGATGHPGLTARR